MVKSHEQRLFNAKRIVFYPYKYYQRERKEEEEREEREEHTAKYYYKFY